MSPVLKLENLTVRFGGTTALNDVSLELNQGEILGIVGESGSGKTTLLKTATGLLENACVSGSVLFADRDLLKMPEKELRRVRGGEIGLIFQDAAASLCPVRRVGAQMVEALRAHGESDKLKAKRDALELFSKLNFADPERVWNSYPMELSGGMNQRVGIALAMVLSPQVLFCDEPTSALDTGAARSFLTELEHVREQFGTSIVLVTHDIGVAEAVSDRVVVMQNGRIVEQGAQVLTNPTQEYTKKLLAAVPRLRRA